MRTLFLLASQPTNNTCPNVKTEGMFLDRYWGDGGDGSGKNMLGKILMRVRDNLREQQQ